MGFSIEWEKTYQTGAHNSVWPWSEVVSLTNRYFKGDKSGLRVLDWVVELVRISHFSLL